MSIYVIADLHLSFENNKPMDVFGDNWENHAIKIKKNWVSRVKENDLVVLPGDFSWAMYLKETLKDFEFLSSLPGKKILLKGNHDYWWTTLNKMKTYLKEHNFNNIDFLYNNSFFFENKILVGTRGWSLLDSENSQKMINRENERLKISIEDGIKKYGNDKKIICFMHYPPISSKNILENKNLEIFKTLKRYGITKCYYGHLHGTSHKEAVNDIVEGIEFKLISSDYLNFDLIKI